MGRILQGVRTSYRLGKSKNTVRFGAVESECRIYLNGKYVGEHTGSMTQFEKDLITFPSSCKKSTTHLRT